MSERCSNRCAHLVGMPAAITEDVKRHYTRLRTELGFSKSRAAREAGVSRSWAHQYETDNPWVGGGKQKKDIEKKVMSPPPLKEDALSEEGKRSLRDFGFFREFFFARQATPWQEKAAYTIEDLLDSPRKEYVVLNCPPGVGKTTTFTHDIPAWLIAKERRTRILLGHSAKNTANQYSRRIKLSLERTDPYVDPQLDIEAKGVMCNTFGRFKPDVQDLWRNDEFVVEQMDSRTVQEKEATVKAAGQDSGFLGGRFNLNVWDDLVTPTNQRTPGKRDQQRDWWVEQAETRCEPGGLVLLMGQRIAANDLFRFALDMGLPVHLLDGETDRERKYHHVVFPAHDEANCEDDHGLDAAYWPDGCLLDPQRAPWFDLAALKENDARRFQTVFQQKDGDPDAVLVQESWIEGGPNEDGSESPGCLDYDRDIAEWPAYLPPPAWTAVTVDPSATNYWSVQWWGYDSESEARVLLDHKRDRMQSPQFLDRVGDRKYIGLLNDWVERASDMGIPINHLVVERNAAQRWMYQYEFFQSFLRRWGINLFPHDTTSNKADPEMGVWSTLPNAYKLGRVRLPWKPGFGRKASQHIVDEVTVWPGSSTDDCVMSQWFLEYNIESLDFSVAKAPSRAVPSWAPKRSMSKKSRQERSMREYAQVAVGV